jgi:uncharacterized iron-regulated membrane protein
VNELHGGEPPPGRTVQPRATGSVRSLRTLRPLHRWIGLLLAAVLVVSSATGILLGWKKHSDLLQPPTQRGASADMGLWRPLHEIHDLAQHALADHLRPGDARDLAVDRLDARPGHGIVKVLFVEGYWEVQVDATTGEIRSIARRHSDWIEQLHDGSIIHELFKFGVMNVLGVGLLFLALTGCWLGYAPHRIRIRRRSFR